MVRESTYTWYQNMVSQTQRRLAALQELTEDPQRFHGRAESPEGIVAVMAPNGTAVSLELSHTALRMGPEGLAEAILRTQRAAAADAAEQYAEALREAVPDGAMGRFDEASIREAGQQLRDSIRQAGGQA